MHNSQYSLSSDHFVVELDSEHASIQTLRHPSESQDHNLVLQSSKVSHFDVEDSRFLGDLVFHVRREHEDKGSTMTSGLSKDIRSISQSGDSISVKFDGAACKPGGFQGFTVMATYSLKGASGDTLDWTIELTNTTSETLIFEDFGFPMPMNSLWGNDQTQNYESGVHRHSFVAKHGSYIYWQRPSGEGPILLMSTHQNTSLEFRHRYREGEPIFGEKLPNWEGLVEYFIHSRHISATRSDVAGQYLAATTLTLSPGESKKYGFTFRWANGYSQLRNAIYASGGLDVISMPGMVVTKDSTALVALRTQDEILSVKGEIGKDVKIAFWKVSKDYRIYKLTLCTLGTNFITVTFDDSRSTVLQYYCIEPMETLIKSRASFLSKNQQAKTNKGFDGAFLQWDMTTQKLITWDNYPGGGWKEWMAGGSDDLGLAPAAFLSEKCVTFPVQSEVSAIDYYIEKFLFGYLCAKGPDGELTFQVYRWYDGRDGKPHDAGIWRAYNYTHIANTFFNMYRIGRAYTGLNMRYTPREYINFAYEVLNAMYSKIPVPNPIGDAANELGIMGESTVPLIAEALGQETLISQKERLLSFVKRKLDYYQRCKYPFASEMTIDTTGFESVYALSKTQDMRTLIDKSQKASLACRGLQPLWYFYGGDNRMMGESYWNLGYETQLGAWQQLDYLVNYSGPDGHDFTDMLRSSYGAYLAGWSNINSGQIDPDHANYGAAAWLWQSEGGSSIWPWIPLIGNWWAWSGEVDLGLWGALRAASAFVVDDPIMGLYAYGADVTSHEAGYLIRPVDGVRQRFTCFNVNNLSVEIGSAQYTNAIVGYAGDFLEIDLEFTTDVVSTPTITIKNALAGEYEGISPENLETQRPSWVDKSTMLFKLKRASGGACRITIRQPSER